MVLKKYSIKISDNYNFSNFISSKLESNLIFLMEQTIVSDVDLFILKNKLTQQGVSFFYKLFLGNKTALNFINGFFYVMIVDDKLSNKSKVNNFSLYDLFNNLYLLMNYSNKDAYASISGKKFSKRDLVSFNLRSTILFVKNYNFILSSDVFFFIFDFFRKYNNVNYIFVVFFSKLTFLYLYFYGNFKSNS